jgi:RHS repeat-associated protein
LFTDKERDSESGLDFFGARYYGSALGRFTSADPSNLQKSSYDTDYNNCVNGHNPQDPEDSFVHGMSDGVHNQDPMAAQAMGDDFVAQNENSAEQAQANWIASAIQELHLLR